MKNKQLSCLAAASCTSKATVSKVLNHCYGVGTQVRHRVFAEADRMRAGDPADPAAVYVIFPESPGDFKNYPLLHTEQVRIKYNVYSHMGDEQTLLRYLDQAQAMEAKAIVLAARLTPGLSQRLLDLTQRCLVIFVSEYADLTNTFFVGSDPMRDVKLLASACDGETGRWLIWKDNTPACQARFQAFMETMTAKAEFDILEADPELDTGRSPSMLARALSQRITGSHCGVICLNGHTAAICGAIRKLKLPNRVMCVGCGNDALEAQYAQSGILKAAVYPNTYGHLERAMQLACRYVRTGLCPDRKFVFMDSCLKEYR